MIAKVKQLKWTEKPESSRDLVFIILILGIGIVLVAKLAPHFREPTQSVVYSSVQAVTSPPRSILDHLMEKASLKEPNLGKRRFAEIPNAVTHNHPVRSVLDRPLFDGRVVLVSVRSLTSLSSKDPNPTIEVAVLRPIVREHDAEVDFTPAEGATLVGKGEVNSSIKRIFLHFAQLITRDGQSYPIQGEALDPESLTAGIPGDYSSGLPARLLGVAIDRAINVGDEIAMAHLFSSTGPEGVVGQDFKRAAMETNQQASQSVAAEATQGLRETQVEISLKPNTEFLVRLWAKSSEGGSP